MSTPGLKEWKVVDQPATQKRKFQQKRAIRIGAQPTKRGNPTEPERGTEEEREAPVITLSQPVAYPCQGHSSSKSKEDEAQTTLMRAGWMSRFLRLGITTSVPECGQRGQFCD
jgi:hypothetical protein